MEMHRRRDGLLLQGGADVAPESYREAPLRPEWSGDVVRDRYEIALVHSFMAARKPVLTYKEPEPAQAAE